MPNDDSDIPVTITAADGCQIPARFRHRDADSACVLLLHGITTNKNEYANFYIRLSNILSELAIATLRIDFRGHGDSAIPSERFTIASQVLDVIAAIDWIAARGFASTHLFGASFGAAPSLYSSQWRPNAVASTTLLCPVLDYDATFLHPTTEWARAIFSRQSIAKAWETGRLAFNDQFSVGVSLLAEMSMIVPYIQLRQMHKPVTVIHGTADSMVPFEISARLCAGLSHVNLVSVEHMEHGFTDVDDDAGTSQASISNLNLIASEIVRAVRGGGIA